ncbi:MAG: hypothetical protein ACK46C_00475 [Flavobacteriales bacterium]
MFSIKDGKYEYDEKLSRLIAPTISWAVTPVEEKVGSSAFWRNKEHGIKMVVPDGFNDEEMTESNMLMNKYDSRNNRRIQVIYSDDYSFKVLRNKDYLNSVNSDDWRAGLLVNYKDVEINIWQPQFHTVYGTVFHVIYTGVLLTTGQRQTSVIAQFIDNGKLYTIRGVCMPEDLRDFHNLMRSVYDSIVVD